MMSEKFLCAIFILILPISSQTRVITVDDDGPADYEILYLAVENAMPHDTILVAEGEYPGGPLYITKPLTLLGAGQDQSIISGLINVISINSDSVKIDGFTFSLGFMPPDNENLYISHCSPEVTNIKFINDQGWWPTYTIEINGSSSPHIHNCNFPEDWNGIHIQLHSDSLDVYAEKNWWGTSNENEIIHMIHDSHYDSSLGTIHFKPFLTQPTAVESREIDHLITTYNLHQNYPNPFNSSTTISYDLSKEGHIRLSIYSITNNIFVFFVKKFRLYIVLSG